MPSPVSERRLGEKREAIIAVKNPEHPGSFKRIFVSDWLVETLRI